MYFFSIISICRNNLNELIQTYKSIESQSYTNYEWIVIDGNSNDGTIDWLQKNKRATWISEPDAGIFDAMNKGLNKTSGNYLIFMNSGDEFASVDILGKIEAAISNHGYPGFVYGDALDIDENGHQHYRKAKNIGKNWAGMITQHQAMFFSRASVGETKYLLEFPTTADYAFISEIIKKLETGNIFKVNFPICKFNLGGTNEQERFKALKEDFSIRKNIMGLPYIINKPLYYLHFFHTMAKKKNPNIRFVRHKTKHINL